MMTVLRLPALGLLALLVMGSFFVVPPGRLGPAVCAQTTTSDQTVGQEEADKKAQAQPAESSATPEPSESDDERRERISAEKFFEVLKKRPRLGTALDKVYGYYVGRGTLLPFVESLEQQATATNDGNLWLVLGMVQLQRGQDGLAASAFEKAGSLLPDQPLASYYLGKSLVLLGETEEATGALRRAVKRKPSRADTLAIFKDLGRIYQRTGRNEEALIVWKELEELFPGDVQVKEEIAAILSEEGALEAALERYAELSTTIKDRFRQVEMSIRAAQLKARLGRTDEALADFEQHLDLTNPDSWLHRDVRRRIEEVFWASNDVDGLVKYYSKWTEKHPEDIEAMMRSARVLFIQRRLPEAEKWFRQAIEKAPSRTEPRQALVDALVTDGRYDVAAQEMAELVELEPENPDYIVRWGELVWNDNHRDEAERKAAAEEIWLKMLENRGDDPVTVSRVADLLRSTGASETAITHYRTAIKLAPDDPQYREYLGEYLHQLKRGEEALAVWRELASGDRETRENLVRLSEVLSTFKYDEEALGTMARACELKPTFAEHARYADLLRQAAKYDEALAQLDLAEPLADDPELRELVIDERIKVYQASGSLEDRIEQAQAAVAGAEADSAEAWRLLALLHDAMRKFQPACEAIEKATRLDDRRAIYWETAAAIQQRAGKLAEAVKSYRKLASLDRRFLSNYLMQIANLEMRLGNSEAALKTAEELMATAAGNSEHYRFYADLSFRLGQPDRGLEALRRNVRSNPNDEEAVLYLARQLASEFHTDEAIELYWKAFDLAKDMDDQTNVITQLAELYLRTNRFETLSDRLDLMGRERNKPRDGMLWVAAAHQAAGDLGKAKELLEQLAREDSRDTRLLSQLVALAQSESDYETAAEYQQRLVVAAPTPQNEYRFANFLLELGEVDRAQAMWQKLAQRKNTPNALSASIGTLLGKEEFEVAIGLIERALQDDAEDWESMAAAIVCHIKLEQAAEAQQMAERLLALSVPLSEPSERAKQAIAKHSKKHSSFFNQYANLGNRSQMRQQISQVRRLFGQDERVYYGASRSFRPNCFLDARYVALSVPFVTEEKQFDESEFVDARVREAITSNDVDGLWDAVYLLSWVHPNDQQIILENEQYEQCLDKLIEMSDPSAAAMKLNLLMNQATRNRSQQEPLDKEVIAEASRLAKLSTGTHGYQERSVRIWTAAQLAYAGDVDEANAIVDEVIESVTNPAERTQFLIQTAQSLVNPGRRATPKEWQVEKCCELLIDAFTNGDSKTMGRQGWGQQIGSTMDAVAKHDLNSALDVVDAILHWQARAAAAKRPSQRNRLPSNPSIQYHVYDKGRYAQRSVQFPMPSDYFGASAICALHALNEVVREDTQQLETVRQRVTKWADTVASNDEYATASRLMAKAAMGHWNGDSKAAATAIEAATELEVASPVMRQAMAQLLFQAGEKEEALQVIESLRPTNQRMLVDRELAILQLVLELGDVDRAKKSAQKLYALRLKPDTGLKLAEVMYQLGMKELGDRMMSRMRRRAGGQRNTLVKLMQGYADAGDNKAAAEIARQVVRRTQPAVSAYMRTSDSQHHQQAVKVLARTGELTEIIERFEKLVERSPKSHKLANQLASFYKAAGRRDDARQLLMKSAEAAPNNPQSLLQAAKQFVEMNEPRKAIDKYLEALAKSPNLLNNHYYEFDGVFNQDGGKGYDRFVDGLIEIGLRKFGHSYQLSNIASQLFYQKRFDVLNRLLATGLKELSSSQASQLMNSLGSRDFEPSEEVVQLLEDKLCGKVFDVGNEGNAYVWSRGSNGQTHAYGTAIARIVSNDDALKQRVTAALRRQLDESPEARFQRVLLALIHLFDEDYDELDKLAGPLLEKEDKDANDVNAIWCLSSALVHEQKRYEQAIDYLATITDRGAVSQGRSEFEFTLDSLEVFAYEKAGRHKTARQMLLTQMKTMEVDEQQAVHNPGYGEYRYIHSMASLASRFLDMGYAAEGFLAYRKAFGNEAMTDKAKRWGGNLKREEKRLQDQLAEVGTSKKIISILAEVLDCQAAAENAAEDPATAETNEDAVADQPAPSTDDQDRPADSADPAAGDVENSGQPDGEMLAYLVEPSIQEESLINVRVALPLEEFTAAMMTQENLKECVSEWLDETALTEESTDRSLQVLLARLLVCNAVENEEQGQATAAAIVGWIDQADVQRSGSSGASADDANSSGQVVEEPGDEPGPGATSEEDAAAWRDELLIMTAVLQLPESALEPTRAIELLTHAAQVAAERGELTLARRLRCETAKRMAADDREQATRIFVEALDELLPQQAGAAGKDNGEGDPQS